MRPANPNRPTTPIAIVTVPESAMTSPAPHDLPEAVGIFVDRAFSREYVSAELPHEALIAHWLFIYEGEVRNGGHSQFVANKGEYPGIYDFVAEGLRTLGLSGVEAIFSDLLTFSIMHPKRFSHGGRWDKIDPVLHALDDRFYALPLYGVPIALSAWLKSRPWLSAVPDHVYHAVIGQLIPDHPLLDARRERRRPAAEAQRNALFRIFARSKPTRH